MTRDEATTEAFMEAWRAGKRAYYNNGNPAAIVDAFLASTRESGWTLARVETGDHPDDALADVVQKFMLARLKNDSGNYAGWRIAGKNSLNEAFEAARAMLAAQEE